MTTINDRLGEQPTNDVTSNQNPESKHFTYTSYCQEPSQPPVAKAGLDQQIKEGETVALDGAASSDPDKGNVISFSWDQLSPKKPIVTIDQNSPNSPKATFQAPIVDKDTLLTIRLTVKDNNGGKATDLVKVLVKNQVTDKENPALQNQTTTKQEQQQSPTTTTNSQVPIPSKENNNNNNNNDNVAVNHAPIATGASISADQNKPIIISLQASDSDKDDKLTFLSIAWKSFTWYHCWFQQEYRQSHLHSKQRLYWPRRNKIQGNR